MIHLQEYYSNIFKETQASWPRTKRGLEQLRQRHPDAIWFVAHTAMLASLARDRALAKEMFDVLGDRYVAGIWKDRTLYVRFKTWAETGRW